MSGELTPEQQVKCDLLGIKLEYDDFYYHDTDPLVSGPGWVVMSTVGRKKTLSYIKRGSGRFAFRSADAAIKAAVLPEAFGCRWIDYNGA